MVTLSKQITKTKPIHFMVQINLSTADVSRVSSTLVYFEYKHWDRCSVICFIILLLLYQLTGPVGLLGEGINSFVERGQWDQTQILVGTNLAKVTTSWGIKAPIKSSYVIAVYSMISHTNRNDAMFLITCTHSWSWDDAMWFSNIHFWKAPAI